LRRIRAHYEDIRSVYFLFFGFEFLWTVLPFVVEAGTIIGEDWQNGLMAGSYGKDCESAVWGVINYYIAAASTNVCSTSIIKLACSLVFR